jgi:hypothetical protein
MSSLEKIWRMWVSIVLGLRKSASPIALLERPSAGHSPWPIVFVRALGTDLFFLRVGGSLPEEAEGGTR